MKTDNHYLPRLYLRQWTSSPQKVWVYRNLVSHRNVPLWKECWITGLAKHEHLYTSVVGEHESDQIEQWLDREFESPAASSIQRVVGDAQMDKEDWRRLVRFAAAQDVRTPVRLMEHLSRWKELMPKLLDKTVSDVAARLEHAIRTGDPIPKPQEVPWNLPLKVSFDEESHQSQHVQMKAEIVVGRETWLFAMRHLLTSTIKNLEVHRWTILKPAKGLQWFTSDNPVIKLNLQENGGYGFDGGWGKNGTEILFPLGPQHLVYARVGARPPQRGATLSEHMTRRIRSLIAEHSHRLIISSAPDAEIDSLRERRVDASELKAEREMWNGWHASQAQAVRGMGASGNA